jgi:acetylornithine deacetylase/succinyl-diaminopimelate desuccinylase-like protein
VKLDALCKIAAALRLRGRRLGRPFWLCGTAAEEVGLRGARRLAQSPLFASLGVRQVLCGEPTELELYDAHKGYAVVRCILTDTRAPIVSADGPPPLWGPAQAEQLDFAGKAAHSSTPHLGVNAINRAAAWAKASRAPILAVRGGASANTVPALCTLTVPALSPAAAPAPDKVRSGEPVAPTPDLSRALQTAFALSELWVALLGRLEPREDGRFDPPGAVGGFNVVTGGADPAAPAAASATHGRARLEATFDARLLPQHDPEALFALFDAASRSWVDKLGGGELQLEISIERNAAGMSLPEGSPLVTALSATLARLGLDGTPRKKPTSTEAGVFSRAGCEAVVIGPGRSTGNAHTANERILVSQLERAIELYTAILEDLCAARPA